MDRQTTKIRKLIELRQRDVDSELSHLSVARREVARSEAELARVRMELQQALEERRTMMNGALDVNAWRNLEEWMETLSIRQAKAANDVAVAKVHERRAVARLGVAHKKKKQADMLLERLERARRLTAVRAERKQEDELAQRHVLRRAKEDA